MALGGILYVCDSDCNVSRCIFDSASLNPLSSFWVQLAIVLRILLIVSKNRFFISLIFGLLSFNPIQSSSDLCYLSFLLVLCSVCSSSTYPVRWGILLFFETVPSVRQFSLTSTIFCCSFVLLFNFLLSPMELTCDPQLKNTCGVSGPEGAVARLSFH